MIPVLLFLLFFSAPPSPAEDHARARMKNAENFLKAGKPLDAYEEANIAVAIEPKNKKYAEKLRKIGEVASKFVEAKARGKMETDPNAFQSLIREALRYDPSNISAKSALNAFNARLKEVQEKTEGAILLLDSGRLTEVEAILDSVNSFKDVVPRLSFWLMTEISTGCLRGSGSCETTARGDDTTPTFQL